MGYHFRVHHDLRRVYKKVWDTYGDWLGWSREELQRVVEGKPEDVESDPS